MLVMKALMSSWVGQLFWHGASAHLRHLRSQSTLGSTAQPTMEVSSTDIKYSLDFLRPIRTARAFEAVDWLADLHRRTWPTAE